MLKKLLENSNEVANFEDMMRLIEKKLRLKIVWMQDGEGYAEFKTRDNRIFRISQDFEGMQYTMKILDKFYLYLHYFH